MGIVIAMLPNRLLTSALLRRSTRLWMVVRAALSGLVFLAGTNPLRLPVATTVGVLVICVAVGYVELHINHERDLFANLGIKRRNLALLFLMPALAGEMLVRAVAALL
jgi:hypothetical protein